jgi:hypothetical protein
MVSTQFNGDNTLTPATEGETTTLVYKPDSTVDQYRNGVRVGKGRPFSVRRTAHPSGAGVIDVMVCPDETGFTEPYQYGVAEGRPKRYAGIHGTQPR